MKDFTIGSCKAGRWAHSCQFHRSTSLYQKFKKFCRSQDFHYLTEFTLASSRGYFDHRDKFKKFISLPTVRERLFLVNHQFLINVEEFLACGEIKKYVGQFCFINFKLSYILQIPDTLYYFELLIMTIEKKSGCNSIDAW